jgi:cytochrome c551/c552
VDKGDDELVLVDKKSFEIKKIKPLPGKKFTHTEFSKDGRYAYLSIFDKNGQLLIYDTIMHTELARFDNSLPVGKYNVFNKEREFLPVSLGSSVFTAKCWGCHHETSMAFGPSFTKIASTRDAQMIRTHLDNPRINAVNLGYKNPTMPNIPLSETEKDMVTMYVKSFKKRLIPISLYNMAQHQLDKPERIAKTCDDYITWTKLGFSPFKEIDKKNEEIFKEICL